MHKGAGEPGMFFCRALKEGTLTQMPWMILRPLESPQELSWLPKLAHHRARGPLGMTFLAALTEPDSLIHNR